MKNNNNKYIDYINLVFKNILILINKTNSIEIIDFIKLKIKLLKDALSNKNFRKLELNITLNNKIMKMPDKLLSKY